MKLKLLSFLKLFKRRRLFSFFCLMSFNFRIFYVIIFNISGSRVNIIFTGGQAEVTGRESRRSTDFQGKRGG